jgi:hypothetical protein
MVGVPEMVSLGKREGCVACDPFVASKGDFDNFENNQNHPSTGWTLPGVGVGGMTDGWTLKLVAALSGTGCFDIVVLAAFVLHQDNSIGVRAQRRSQAALS